MTKLKITAQDIEEMSNYEFLEYLNTLEPETKRRMWLSCGCIIPYSYRPKAQEPAASSTITRQDIPSGYITMQESAYLLGCGIDRAAIVTKEAAVPSVYVGRHRYCEEASVRVLAAKRKRNLLPH